MCDKDSGKDGEQVIVELAKRLGFGRSRAATWFYHRFLSREPHPANMPHRDVVLETDNQKILVANPAQSNIGRSIFFHGVWEPEATRFITPRVTAGMTVVDVGAHTGYYTILFARRVGQSGRVLAFEPEQRGLEFLHENLRLNDHRNVTVHPLALSNRAARVTECDKAFFVADDQDTPDSTAEEAAVRVFDDLIPELGIDRLDIVKIDVEGAELHVLEGMGRALAQWHPAILLEIHPRKMEENCGRTAAQLEEFLVSHGYRTEPVSPPSPSGVYTVYCTASEPATPAATREAASCVGA